MLILFIRPCEESDHAERKMKADLRYVPKTKEDTKELKFRMNRTLVNYIVDIPLLLLTLLEGVSGLILQFGGRGMSGWRQIHELCGAPMVILFVIHLVLHWRWVVCVTKNTFGLNKKNTAQTCSTE